MTLYFAYGSNLNIEQMLRRCPRAKPLSKMMLRDSALVFRGVADSIFEKGSTCPGGLWKITPACERALDVYEGIASGLYRKEYVTLDAPVDGERQMMLYVMNSDGIMPPSQGYLNTIIEGYKDFGLPAEALREAVARSWKDKNPSHIERKRRRREGNAPRALSRNVAI